MFTITQMSTTTRRLSVVVCAVVVVMAALLLPSGGPLVQAEGVSTPALAFDGWSQIEAESYDSSEGSLDVCGGFLCYVGANACAI